MRSEEVQSRDAKFEPQVILPDITKNYSSDTLAKDTLRNLYMADHESLCKNCHFWMGLSGKGSVKATPLQSEWSLATLFDKEQNEGIIEQDPVLLTSTLDGIAKYYYVLPTPNIQNLEAWSFNLAQTVSSMNIRQAGLYLSSKLLNISLLHTVLYRALKALCAQSRCQEYFILYPKTQLNLYLKTLLTLKSSLSEEKNIEVAIFH